MSGILEPFTSGILNQASGLFGGGPVGAERGNRTFFRGRPIMVRDSRYASKLLLKGTGKNLNIPKPKFLFFARFTSTVDQSINASGQQTGISFMINSVDKPNFDLQTDTLNQYNKKRIIYKKLEYPNINLKFHDVADERVTKFWRNYYRYFFGDGRKTSDLQWNPDIVSGSFNLGEGWGFAPKAGIANDSNLFRTLELYSFFGRFYTQIDVIHPKITRMQFDANDSTDTSPASASMEVAHEGIVYKNIFNLLSSEKLRMMGLYSGDYYEPQDLFGGINSFLMGLTEDFSDAVDGLFNDVSSAIPGIGSSLGNIGGNVLINSGVGSVINPTIPPLAGIGSALSNFGNFRF